MLGVSEIEWQLKEQGRWTWNTSWLYYFTHINLVAGDTDLRRFGLLLPAPFLLAMFWKLKIGFWYFLKVFCFAFLQTSRIREKKKSCLIILTGFWRRKWFHFCNTITLSQWSTWNHPLKVAHGTIIQMVACSKNRVQKNLVVIWVRWIYFGINCMVLLSNVRKSHLRIHSWYRPLQWQLIYLLVKNTML